MLHGLRLLRHLHVLVARTRARDSISGSGSRCMSVWILFRDHAIQVDLDDLALEDAEVALRTVVLTNTNDADRCVVDRELLVLLERLSEGM